MKSLFAIVLFCAIFFSQDLFSQSDDISTDRPDQSESPLLVNKGCFQIEAGFITENDAPTKDVNINVLTIPGLLFRYGLSKNVEIRAGIEVINKKTTVTGTKTTSNGFGPIVAGTKIKLFTEKGSFPETAFLFNLTIPFKKESEFQSEYIFSEFRVAMSNTLNKRFTLSYNLGGEWGAGQPGMVGIYTLSLGAVITKKLSAFGEIYGFLPEGSSPDHRLDGGFTYLFMKNIQADISAGIGLSDESPDYFIGFGLSLRLPK